MNDEFASSDFQVSVQPATRLLREVIEHSGDYSRMISAHLDVNQTDFEAMEHLITNGPMTAGDLARAVGISPGSATVMIDRLEAVGHVTREPNPNDRRGVLVSPNPKSVAEAWKHISPLIIASEEALAAFKPADREAIETYPSATLRIYTDSASR